jgi:putative membrane protein
MLCLCRDVALALPALTAGLTAETVFAADDTVSAADHAFVMKVSQGGMFEVEASKVANQKATEQDVIDVSLTEVHDHQLVGAKLMSIASEIGITLPTTLNPQFQARLDKLKSLSGAAFDDAYIKEMDEIHAVDVLAFADEAKHGRNGKLRAFAAETVLIVRRHIGALHAVPLPTT